jgi:hypothetical protein
MSGMTRRRWFFAALLLVGIPVAMFVAWLFRPPLLVSAVRRLPFPTCSSLRASCMALRELPTRWLVRDDGSAIYEWDAVDGTICLRFEPREGGGGSPSVTPLGKSLLAKIERNQP